MSVPLRSANGKGVTSQDELGDARLVSAPVSLVPERLCLFKKVGIKVDELVQKAPQLARSASASALELSLLPKQRGADDAFGPMMLLKRMTPLPMSPCACASL